MTRVGSVIVEFDPGGNLVIRKSHTPHDHIIIERVDIDDLLVALDGVLGDRQPEPEPRAPEPSLLRLTPYVESEPCVRVHSDGSVVISDGDIERISAAVVDRMRR